MNRFATHPKNLHQLRYPYPLSAQKNTVCSLTDCKAVTLTIDSPQ
ncbi:hypothetical protein APA_4262 [Pseudanabaena sp. lw0831]|nr:hypothetical protein APA_359 [Pseudanabaena sp. lw0831]GBO52793.1 hypothetical protein APA_594 [Pseudanabaena sp. lw0831]GBO52827.1 hypothetical protein APA_628 [Pseudanabaena sp. lw0831]GBO52856.1 hypothetical protein APA_657 [Pseudanabaena sp. lw0831]GBO53383.1 hypothetical protein APA_1290 [Pseudanabaena sp. lw0831]